MFIPTLVATLINATEVGGFIGFLKWKKYQQVKDDLYSRHKRPREIKIVDTQVRRLIGSPTKFQKMAAMRAAALALLAVNTKAFELLLQGLLNPKSRLRRDKNRLKEVEVTL
jgi:hypothetical protein